MARTTGSGKWSTVVDNATLDNAVGSAEVEIMDETVLAVRLDYTAGTETDMTFRVLFHHPDDPDGTWHEAFVGVNPIGDTVFTADATNRYDIFLPSPIDRVRFEHSATGTPSGTVSIAMRRNYVAKPNL